MIERKNSAALLSRAASAIPGAVNSPVRAWRAVGGQTIFIQRGEGAAVVDADGNRDKMDAPAVAPGKRDMSIHVLDAEPVVGWDEYNQYLEKNKKLPDSTAAVHGMVVVRFVVTNKGVLKNFSIEKSLNEALDAEAIRLVKEGPSWRLLKGRKAKASVMVNF